MVFPPLDLYIGGNHEGIRRRRARRFGFGASVLAAQPAIGGDPFPQPLVLNLSLVAVVDDPASTVRKKRSTLIEVTGNAG